MGMVPSRPRNMKVVVFRFQGGVLDGQALRSDGPESAKREVDAIWRQTWKATIGRRFDASDPKSVTFQRYQIAGRYEVGDEVHVTCQRVS
jgi:hypothetical protein